MMDWRTSLNMARSLVPPGPRVGRASARALVSTLRSQTEWASDVARELSGLPASAFDGINVRVVDRRRWVGEAACAIEEVSPPQLVGGGAKVSAASALGMAAALTYGATKLTSHVTMSSPAQVVVIAPNVASTELSTQVDAVDYRRWVLLRSTLWAAQFGAAPWLPGYIRELVAELLTSAADAGHGMSLPRLIRAARDTDPIAEADAPLPVKAARWAPRGYTLAGDATPVGTGDDVGEDLLSSSESVAACRHAVDQLARLSGLMSAYQRVCLERVTPQMLPSVNRILAQVLAPSATDLLVRALGRSLGLGPVAFHSARSRQLLRLAYQNGGVELVNRIFESPQNLPSGAEFADATAWVERMSLGSTL